MTNLQRTDELLIALELIRQAEIKPSARLAAIAKLFHQSVLALTNEKGYAFRNFYTRFRFLLSRLPLSATDQANIEAFRRYLREADYSKIPARVLDEALNLVEKIIMGKTRESLGNYFTKLVSQRNYGALENFKVLCESWTELELINGRASFTLSAFNLEEMTRQLQIRIHQDEYDNPTYIRRWLTPGSILQLHNVRQIKDAADTYETTFDSLLTLEPDYLLDATSIGECFSRGRGNGRLFWLNHLVQDLPDLPALRGSIIGYYLDELFRAGNLDTDAIYNAAQKNNAMNAARFGRERMNDVKRTIHTEHLTNIRSLVADQGQKELWIEPTYFSTNYGLQGRIDLLTRDTGTESRDIIELKSGSPSTPASLIAWLNHKMQVVCYDMMLESTYGDKRKGINTIYYSKCTVEPYRVIVSEHREKKMALSIRNEIVANVFRLAAKDFSTLNEIKTNGIPDLPPYKVDPLELFQTVYEPGRITTEYYQQMVSFLLRELINTKVGYLLRADEEDGYNGFAGLWLDSLEDKLQDFRIIFDMTVQTINHTDGVVTLTFSPEIEHAFRKGDPVVLYPRTEKGYDVRCQHILKGSIGQIQADTLTVLLNNKQTNYDFIKNSDRWAIEPDIFEKNTWSTIAGLFNLLLAENAKKKLLFGYEPPAVHQKGSYQNDQLTEIQRLAIEQALDAKDYYLLQGPPGTGKTSVFLLNYIRESIRRDDHCIVVLAFTNRAVDKICEAFANPRFGAPVPYLRMGSRHVDDNALFSRQIDGDDPDRWNALIRSHRVFVATVSTFQNHWALLNKFFPYQEIVIDEASQLTEAAIAGILVLFNKFILIGDQKQLPAVVTQDPELCRIEGKYMEQLGLTDLRISLFERMLTNAKKKGWSQACGQLQNHYRMHADIAALIASHYEAPLITGTNIQETQAPLYALPQDHWLAPVAAHRTVFIQSPADQGIKKNQAEATMVAEIVEVLLTKGPFLPSDIGVIAPFRAQVAAIKKCLPPNLAADASFVVDTVERYQGDERKIIIFSTAICRPSEINTIQSIWEDEVSTTDRKLLVSISRAKSQLIVLGVPEALNSSAAYRQLLQQIAGKGANFSWQELCRHR